MAINQASTTSAAYEVKNDAPQVFFSTRTAILVLVDGTPVLRPVKNTNLQRVINTRVLMLRDQSSGKFYLRVMDGWLEATDVSGPWTIAARTPDELNNTLDEAIASKQVDLLDASKTSLATAVVNDAVPTIFVSTQPAELLQTQGDPQVTHRRHRADLRCQH